MASCCCSTSTAAASRAYVKVAAVPRVWSGVHCVPRSPAARRALVVRRARGGLAESDTVVTPGKSTEGARRKPPIYKVMLHNDNYNRREYVVKVLIKVVEGMTVDDAVGVMQLAHENGVAVVVACAQDQAESYVEDLRLNGLISTMEPGH
ncbi:ATP-dependent Clp protease adapter chloroplastic-like protein [Raphidocelis subcapitata]|uniref:ATP-dependent Clp protease adapter chloroplastic-like protein n=1 Tax=Raphidocelis subcapitata TaxID=307507 RepID=A0A2V0NK91_9CHLO|nr:ATP-dependent Clp protease adapter chloroplastic-like protein [Raphidocelis subcapitata]|eukprot:GBF87706.1 ATP-dependent Clp protease adapter chloroplastic-like protein [Raphidocelis subcapitata]